MPASASPHPQRARRGALLLQALTVINEVTTEAVTFVEAMMSAGYGASRGRLEREFNRIARKRRHDEGAATERQRYHALLYRLRQSGLIERRTNGVFALTHRGKERLVLLRERFIFVDTPRYRSTPATAWTIIAFDVPERIRLGRNWLRATLQMLEFRMLQRSVWIGKRKLPEAFLADLRRLKLLEFVEIFEITKAGSLRHVA